MITGMLRVLYRFALRLRSTPSADEGTEGSTRSLLLPPLLPPESGVGVH